MSKKNRNKTTQPPTDEQVLDQVAGELNEEVLDAASEEVPETPAEDQIDLDDQPVQKEPVGEAEPESVSETPVDDAEEALVDEATDVQEASEETQEEAPEGSEAPSEAEEQQNDTDDDAPVVETIESAPEPAAEEPEPVAPVVVEDQGFNLSALDDRTQWTTAEAVEKGRLTIAGLAEEGLLSPEEVVLYGRKLADYLIHDADQWYVEDVAAWVKHAKVPERTAAGLLIRDAARDAKRVYQWSDAELSAFLRKEIKAGVEADSAALFDEVRRRYNLDPMWTDNEVRIFMIDGEKPRLAANGMFLSNPLFQLKPAQYWSDQELQLFFKAELPSTKAASDDALYNEYRRRHELSESVYSNQRIQQTQSKASPEKVHMSLTILDAELKTYYERMNRAQKTSEEVAGEMQMSLNRMMLRVLSLTGQDFVTGWTKILDFVHTYRKELFTEEVAMRGMGFMRMSSRDRQRFEQLLNLAIKTADPTVRYSAAAKTNFGVVLANITDEATRQRLLAYYRIGQ